MYFNHEDITLYYEKYGECKKSVVILPGWGNTRKTFDYMISFLKNYFTVYIIDYPGFGNSPFPNKDLTIYDYSDVIYQLIKELNLDNPILIGHSFGGRVITTLLGYYKYNFSNIILINSAGIQPKKTIVKRLRAFSYKLLMKLGNILPKKIKEKWKKYLFNKFASIDYQNLSEDLTPYLKNINSKTLLVWGEKDDATPVKDAYKMNKLINDSELIVLQGLTHFSYLEKPNLINCIIYEQIKDEIID